MYSCQQKNIVLCIEVLTHDNRRKRDLPDHPNQNYDEFSEDGERWDVVNVKSVEVWNVKIFSGKVRL